MVFESIQMGVTTMKRLIQILVLIQVLCLPLLAADFMTGARGGGMGFSYFILADDASGPVYNPAGIGYAGGWQSHMMFDFQNDYEYAMQEDPYVGRLAVVYPFQNVGAFAINMHQSGSMTEVTFVPTVNHATATFGREFATGWSAGTSVKYLFETSYGERSAFDFDVGMAYRSSFGLLAAVAFENMLRSSLSPDYLGFKEHLPRRERLGLGYAHRSGGWNAAFLAAGQIEEWGISEKHTTALMNIGTECWLMPQGTVSLGLRTGFTFGKGVRYDAVSNYSGFSAGTSVNFNIGINDLRIDYGLKVHPYGTTDGSTPIDHFVALNYGWGGVPDYSVRKRSYSSDRNPLPVREELANNPDIFTPISGKESKSSVIDRDTEFDIRHYERFDVAMEVADISTMDFKRIVFYFRPMKIIMTSSWRLYIFKAKIKKWSEQEIDRWALDYIDGTGLPPLNVVWDGVSQNGTLLPPGKYFYILTAEDPNGNLYATEWHKFHLK
jgi:hypothetical protein